MSKHSRDIDDQDDDQLDIDLDLLGIVKRRFHLIALGIFVGASLATIYYVKQVPVYQSNLSVLVGHKSADINSAAGGSLLEGATTTQDSILSTHIELIRSRRILEDAIEQGGLGLSIGQVQGGLGINKGSQGASLLTATFQDTDPKRAAKVLDAIYESYQRYIGNQSQSIGAEAADLIARAQLENEKALRDADEKYREFVASVPAMITADQDGSASIQDVHQMRLSKFESELSDVQRSLARLRSRKAAIQAFVRGRDPQSIDDSEVLAILSEEEVSRLQTFVSVFSEAPDDLENRQLAETLTKESQRLQYGEMLELSSRLSLLKSTFGAGHPSVSSLEDEMRNLEKRLVRFRNDRPEISSKATVSSVEMLQHYFNVIKSDIAGFAEREQELVDASAIEAKLAKEVQLIFMKGSSLKANLDRARSRYDEVFRRLQEINLTNDYTGFSTDLLVAPMPASFPIWPTKSKIAALGVMAGGLLGLGLAMLAEMADRTFRNPEEVEQIVGAPILTHVPRMLEAKLAKKAIKGSLVSPMVAAFHLPRGNEAETFRVLRTSVLFQCKSGGKKVFMMTSPSPSDGKSTTIANLAVSIAQTGKQVLLVDADMRRPTIAKSFGLDKGAGLVDFLTGEKPFSECLRDSEQSSLAICPRGARTSAPAELLESPRFAELIEAARSQFDVILIDAPPLLAVTDPAIIAEHVDGAFLTVRIEKNNRTLVERAAEIIAEVGKPIDGIIVNSRDSRTNAYGYSSYNYYGKKENGYLAKYRDYYAAEEDEEVTPNDSRKGGSSKGGSRSAKPIQASPAEVVAHPEAAGGDSSIEADESGAIQFVGMRKPQGSSSASG